MTRTRAAAAPAWLHADSAEPAHGRATCPPLVLLHGFALHGGLFAPLVAALARRRRVIAVDLPGHGRSPALPAVTLEDTAASVAATVAAAAGTPGPVDVLGWSFGGQVALAWARAEPARVRRMVLACSTPTFVARPGFPWAMAEATLRRFGDELRAAYRMTLLRFLTLQVQGSEAGRATLATLRARLFERGEPAPRSLAATLELLAATDLREAMPQVATPTLVVAGARDALAPPGASQWLAAALPAARLQVLDGAAHAPFLSHPATFTAAVEAFLDE